MRTVLRIAVGLTALACSWLTVGVAPQAQQPPPGAPQAPVWQIPRVPAVDRAAHDRGKVLWAAQCVDCHGPQARGSEKGPNIIRTQTVNFDRTGREVGSVLGPFLKKGHPTQTGKPSASFTADEVIALANFLRERVNETMRSSPTFTAGDVLVGDPKAGAEFFNGAGGCATCHTATTRSLAGIATRISAPVDMQQRMLFPFASGRGRGRGRGAPGAPPPPNPNATTVTVTPASGPAAAGVLVEESDFFVTLREADGTIRVVRRMPGTKIVKNNPLQAHIDLLDKITDKQIHDVVAYLVTLK